MRRYHLQMGFRDPGVPICLLLVLLCLALNSARFPMVALASAAQTTPTPTTLARLRDHRRPLLLFAARPDDPSLLAQMTRLQNFRTELFRRDVVVIAIPFDNPSPTEITLTSDDAIAARRRFHIEPSDLPLF